jgi:hypothetical protein
MRGGSGRYRRSFHIEEKAESMESEVIVGPRKLIAWNGENRRETGNGAGSLFGERRNE